MALLSRFADLLHALGLPLPGGRGGIQGNIWDSAFAIDPGREEADRRKRYRVYRRLYANELNGYELAGGFSRKIIGAKVGFINRPFWRHPNAEVAAGLDDLAADWAAALMFPVRDALRDGDSFARLSVGRRPRIWYGLEDRPDRRGFNKPACTVEMSATAAWNSSVADGRVRPRTYESSAQPLTRGGAAHPSRRMRPWPRCSTSR